MPYRTKAQRKLGFLGRHVENTGPTFEIVVMEVVETVSESLYDTIVLGWRAKYKIQLIIDQSQTLKHHKFSRYVSYVTFQQYYRRMGSHAESKTHFGNKLYGYNCMVSFLPKCI